MQQTKATADTWQWEGTREIIASCRLLSRQTVLALSAYYLLTPFSAAVDGIAWILLIQTFSADSLAATFGPTSGRLGHLLARFCGSFSAQQLLLLVVVLFIFRAFSTLAISVIETSLQAQIRRDLQERCFARILGGRWETLRDQNVGQIVGALTEEVGIFCKYLMSMVRSVYALTSFAVLGLMAFLLAPRLSLLLGAIGVPAWLALKLLYSKQTALSTRQAQARQEFSADVTERLTGLFQIKAAGEVEAHLKTGIRQQAEMTRQEIVLGWLNGALTAFNPILSAVALGAFYLRARWQGQDIGAQMATLGSVGILGFRAVSQLNNLVSALGNLTRLAGCVEPVRKMAALPAEPERRPLPEPLTEIRLENASYAVAGRTILPPQNLKISKGRLFLIMGASGAGKTTLANLVAGLYEPAAGRVIYAGERGGAYDAREFRARIGYVTQDVHMLRGTIRQNLDPWGRLGDEALWQSLTEAGAQAVAAAIGGLDASVAEAGRSFSGGERRRLAIAAALAQKSDCLILDEVTNGLDDTTKAGLLRTVDELSRRILVIAISHDRTVADSIPHARLDLRAPHSEGSHA